MEMLQIIDEYETDYWRVTFLGNRLLLGCLSAMKAGIWVAIGPFNSVLVWMNAVIKILITDHCISPFFSTNAPKLSVSGVAWVLKGNESNEH